MKTIKGKWAEARRLWGKMVLRRKAIDELRREEETSKKYSETIGQIGRIGKLLLIFLFLFNCFMEGDPFVLVPSIFLGMIPWVSIISYKEEFDSKSKISNNFRNLDKRKKVP